MAYAAAHAVVALPRPRASRLTVHIALSVAILIACAFVVGRLVGAVVAEPASTPSMAPVAIATSGHLDVTGLAAGGTTTSAMTITNNGTAAIRWTARPATTGTAGVADQLRMSMFAPAGSSCTAPGTAVSPGTPSAAPLAPGQSATVCVTLSLPADAAATPGTVNPVVTFTGTPA